MLSIQPNDSGGLSWFGQALRVTWRLVGQFLPAYGTSKIVEWQSIDLATVPQDLTGQIVAREPYPTSIGTFSDVWKCLYIFGQIQELTVAVKTIRGHRVDESRPAKIKTLQDQVKRWKTLIHKNILPVYGVTYEFGPLPSLVCPWMDGGSLTHHLETHPDLSPEKRHEILLQICDGLCYLHSEEVMHGQLNGSNILMDRKGNAYLADFGFLPVVLDFRTAPYLSTAIGNSVRWAAPELFEIPETPDGPPLQLTMQSDIYSLGSIILQVLSGDIPYYEIQRDDQVLYAIAQGMKPSQPDISSVTDEQWEYIQQCWSSRRENRRPSAKDVSVFLTSQRLR
ncbi:hypothetical protein PAXRUDRAFT_137135 [Paxillus rubicundulus Ve08.2h10]|uniref:Protein kinase domain-containing protein n=1 Tax=Paxillus rubicundulus Ve08.2h10 TaxID=930991 RepID=A0A0D0E6E4_9AGAM|nr:hypothetical protein PAXRUDRAFT_137135 [Paxillus rubicundulus Ve08.2h10]